MKKDTVDISDYKQTFSTQLTIESLCNMRAFCHEQGVSISAFVENAVRVALKKAGK